MKKIIEKFKSFYDDTYGKLITISWVLLALCLIIKLFGGNWFELNTENSKFIDFCLYVDNNMWLKMILACINYLLSGYISLCVILNVKKFNLKHALIFFPIMICKSIIGWYNSIIAFVIDIIILLVITTLCNKNLKRSIICFIFINAFMIITLLIRNVSFGFGKFNFNNSFVFQMLYQVDYYIMLILFYLYNAKKVKRKEGK